MIPFAEQGGEYMTSEQLRATIITVCARFLFLMICFAVIGGGVLGLLNSQTFNIPERVRAVEIENQNTMLEISMLRQDQARLADAVSELHGIGIAVGSVLAILQIVAMVAAKRQKP